MFRLNRMTDYAIVVLGALARKNGKTVATGQLADFVGLPQPTVAKVSKILLAAGLVETQRGVRGGYRLKKTLANVALVDVVEAVEGPIVVNDCVNGAKNLCAVKNCCCMSCCWDKVNLAIRKALMEVTLEDLTNQVELPHARDLAHLEENQQKNLMHYSPKQ